MYESREQKKFTGPLHFSSMLLKSFQSSKHSFTAIVFEKMEKQERTTFSARLEKMGKNQWLIFRVWIPTKEIIKLKGRPHPDTSKLVEFVGEKLKESRSDIFFLNGFSALTFILMFAVNRLKIPMMATHHGIWYKEWKALDPKLIKKSGVKFRVEIEKDTVRFAKKNVFLSKLSLREFQKHLIKIPKANLEFIPIPYNPVFASKKMPKRRKDKEDLKILFVGRWDAVKNHEAYLNLAKRAKQLGLPWTFSSVVNIFPYKHYDPIRSEYEKYIQVMPTVPAKELKKVYLSSDLTVVPSHFDVYPGVVTESLLQNRPSLISENVGWIDHYREHGIKHWIMDFTSPDKVIAKIKQISREDVPKSLYKRILKENEPKRVFKQYYNLFQQLYNIKVNK